MGRFSLIALFVFLSSCEAIDTAAKKTEGLEETSALGLGSLSPEAESRIAKEAYDCSEASAKKIESLKAAIGSSAPLSCTSDSQCFIRTLPSGCHDFVAWSATEDSKKLEKFFASINAHLKARRFDEIACDKKEDPRYLNACAAIAPNVAPFCVNSKCVIEEAEDIGTLSSGD